MQLAQYIRMSTVLQQDSPETQKSIIREYCQRNGHVVVKTYEDDAISGGSIEKRDALIELVMDAEKRLFEGIIIYKYDRAFRNLAEQVVILSKLRKHNVKVIAAADPNSDGASGELIVNILGSVNQFERQLTGERIYDKNRDLTKKGRWTGSGIDPLGYKYDKEGKSLVIVENEAEIVKLAYKLYLEVKSVSRVTEMLQEMGLKTKKGMEWTKERTHTLLTNPLYAGKLRWGYRKPGKRGKNRQCELFDGQHEPIIAPEVFYKTQETLTHNRNHSSGNTGHDNLLGGLLRCSLCGGPVVANYTKHIKKIVYYCKERYNHGKHYCVGWSRVDYRIENAVVSAVVENIKNIDVLGWEQTGSVPAPDNSKLIEKKLKAIETKLLRQIEMYEDGDIDKETFKARRMKTLQEKEQLDKQLLNDTENKSVNHKTMELLVGFEEIWQGIDVRTRKELLRQLTHKIHSNGFSVKIEFVNLGLPGWQLEAEMPLK